MREKLTNEIGFEYWYSVYCFNFVGPKFNEHKISVKKYEDARFKVVQAQDARRLIVK